MKKKIEVEISKNNKIITFSFTTSLADFENGNFCYDKSKQMEL